MMTYPGYTVDGIQEELSWREVKLLNDAGRKHIPTYHLLTRIEMMMRKTLKYEVVKPEDRVGSSHEELLTYLQTGGFL